MANGHLKHSGQHMETNMILSKNGEKGEIDLNNHSNIKIHSIAKRLETEESALQQFYAGVSVFVTGATGFMGKVLVEKLLRSCPEIDRIYLLVRTKKQRQSEERVDDLVKSPCFDRVRREYPLFRSKLTAICGDMAAVGLGISEEDTQILIQNVGIVFNLAATVRFDEKLKTAILMNVRGPRDLFHLCRHFNKLQAVLHISTAYSQCPSRDIEERFYETPLSSQMAIQMAEDLDEDLLDNITSGILGKWPNSYVFTKALSEEACKRYGQGIPLGLFRPAIVVCTRSEPMPGWIDNLYGPTGAMVGASAGLIRTMHVDATVNSNVVPCDLAINGAIAAAWDVGINRSPDGDAPVYNCVLPRSCNLTWGKYLEYYAAAHIRYPSIQAIWYPYMVYTNSAFTTIVSRLFLHFLPAYLIDLGLFLTGKKPKMVRIYEKIHKFLDVIMYFATRQWNFSEAKMAAVWQKLGGRDQQLFDFNMITFDWLEFANMSAPHLLVNLLKEEPEKLPAARKKLYKLLWLHRGTVFLFVGLLAWSLWIILHTVAALF